MSPAHYNRRQFLAAATLGAASLAADDLSAQASAATADVVVIGAGLAGLQAASILKASGVGVTLLEARDVPGGRVRTVRTFREQQYAEAGAMRVPDLHARVRALVERFRLTMVPFWSSNGSALIGIDGVTRRMPEELGEVEERLALTATEKSIGPTALLKRYVGDVADALADPALPASAFVKWRADDQVTWPEWLRLRGASAGAGRLLTVGGGSQDLSALYVLRQYALLSRARQFDKIHGGMDALPRAMAAAIGRSIRYGAAVTSVDRRDDSVSVAYVQQGTSRTIRASRVVFAVPFSTLRRIVVRPPFSEAKQTAVASLPYLSTTRVLVQSRSRFWHDAGLSGSARTDQPAEMWDATYDVNGSRGILAATIGGEVDRRLQGLDVAHARTAGAEPVIRTFPRLRTELDRVVVHRWSRDEWARGAFAVCRPGQMTSLVAVAATPEGRVHFAGEHTSAWMGWMEGAVESGERAAREILAAAS